MTYKDSGVDIEEKEEAIHQLLSSIRTKRKGTIGRPMGGHYAGLIEFGDYALVLCTDGVGTKVRIAEALKKYDTIGIDCIAMNVNDALCVGAEPLAFVDYLAMEDPNPKITKEIGKGLEKGARLSNISIVGGETADLPELINGFDLAGTCLAYVKKNRIILGDKIHPGDAIIGLSSSGIHSNGYTLARRVIEEAEFCYTDLFPDGWYPKKTIGEIMLTPTRIYVKEILELFNRIDVHGLAHITGSGLWNIPRLKSNVKYLLDEPLEPQPIFRFLQQYGNIDDFEMYQIFNMGMGLTVIVEEEDAQEAIKILRAHSEATVKQVGTVQRGTGVEVPHLKLRYR
ncbi:MAG: phosphoribosylformylglycinamidine cyclo-ligase [Candidatus Thermoplasmatota archaeon]